MEYIVEPDYKSDDVKERRLRHQTLLTPHYVSPITGRVDFDKIKNNPLLIKNYIFSGLLIILDEYYTMYKHLIKSTGKDRDYLEKQIIRIIYPEKQWVHKVLSAGLSLILGDNIHVVLNHELPFTQCLVDKNQRIEAHLRDMATYLGINEEYYITSFMMIPEPYEANVTRWGSSIWILRMYYIYFAKFWKEVNVLEDVAKFLQTMILLLPCKICTHNALYDPIKESVLKTQHDLILSSDEGFIQHAMALEIFLHQRVNLLTYPVDSKVVQNVENLMPMYMELFNNLLMYIKNGFNSI